MLASVDIPFSALEKAYKEAIAKKEQECCQVVPRVSFHLPDERRDWYYSGLVCSPADMNGKATGMGAMSCKNCAMEHE